jgi:serine protease Do
MSVRSASKSTLIRSNFSKILLAGILTGGLSTGVIFAAENVFDSISQEVHTVFDHCQNSVVKIEAVDEHGNLSGTGFFIDPNGTIYTTYTTGGESHDIVVSHGDAKYPAKRLLADSRSGIAILKIEAETPFLPVAKPGELKVSSPVVTIGYPMDLPLTPSFGLVAGFDLKYLGSFFSTTHIRANVPVQRGEGGAPLLNTKGEVVGILISSLDSGSGCFALPIEAAEKVRKEYIRYGDTRPGWIGINIVQAAGEKSGSSVIVNNLLDETPAAKCGLKKGDYVLQVGDTKITAPEDVLNASFFLTAGEEVPITVLRGGEKITVKVQPMMHPAIPRDVATSPQIPNGIPLRMER